MIIATVWPWSTRLSACWTSRMSVSTTPGALPLLEYANSQLKTKMLFGSDYPPIVATIKDFAEWVPTRGARPHPQAERHKGR